MSVCWPTHTHTRHPTWLSSKVFKRAFVCYISSSHSAAHSVLSFLFLLFPLLLFGYLFFVCPLCCSCLLFCGGSAAAVSQPGLLPAPAGATGLPITSPAAENSALPLLLLLLLLPLFVIHCVVTLIIMDSAQVFRLSAGSWCAHIDSHTNMHRHAHVYKPTHAWLRTCTRAHGCRRTQNAIDTIQMCNDAASSPQM